MPTSTHSGQPPAGAYPAAVTDCHLYCWGCTLLDDGTHNSYCHWQFARAEQVRQREEAREQLLDTCVQVNRMLIACVIIAIYAPDLDDEARLQILNHCEANNKMLIARLVRAGYVRNPT